jgi:SAM-dependent methyltransferase
MTETSRKRFGPIRDDYTFFQQHSTEAEADLCAYAPHLHDLSRGDSPIRMLDFGCGDGGFTAAFLGRFRFPQKRLWLSLVDPEASYLPQAVDRLQAFTLHPVRAWPALPAHLHACFELILANHVLYYVPDLTDTLTALVRALATPGLFLTAMGGRANALYQYCLRCFNVLGKPFPFWISEDCEDVLARLGEAYDQADVHYELVFRDSEDHRVRLGRFLMGSEYHAVPRQVLLAGFDPYSHAGQIVMPIVHQHFMVRRQMQGRALLEDQAYPVAQPDSPPEGLAS